MSCDTDKLLEMISSSDKEMRHLGASLLLTSCSDKELKEIFEGKMININGSIINWSESTVFRKDEKVLYLFVGSWRYMPFYIRSGSEVIIL